MHSHSSQRQLANVPLSFVLVKLLDRLQDIKHQTLNTQHQTPNI
jgi:hypothetical protein